MAAISMDELDAMVRAFYEGRGEQQKQAQAALNQVCSIASLSVSYHRHADTVAQFKENPDAWLLVDKILQEAQYPQTKYLGLQVLDNVIMTRWKVLPRDQCLGRLTLPHLSPSIL